MKVCDEKIAVRLDEKERRVVCSLTLEQARILAHFASHYRGLHDEYLGFEHVEMMDAFEQSLELAVYTCENNEVQAAWDAADMRLEKLAALMRESMREESG